MKIKITNESKKILTVYEYENAKRIVAEYRRNDESDVNEIAKDAASGILNSGRYGDYDRPEKVLEASAEIVRDCHTPMDWLGDGCGWLNICIQATVETVDGFLKFDVLLSDVWSLDGSTESKAALVDHGYIRYFTEQKE